MTDSMNWIVESRKAIGPIALGMSKRECISLLGQSFDEFRRTPDAEDITLAFDSEHVHIVVDPQDCVKGISVFRPRNVLLNDVQLLDEDIESVLASLKSKGVKAESVDAGLWCETERLVLVDVDGKVDGVELVA